MKIEILHNGVDIAPDVIFADATFQALANGSPGPCMFRIKDKPHVYEPGHFKTGDTLELMVDDVREWDGWVMTVGRQYAFDVDDTSRPTPEATARFWVINGTDRNTLFTKRVIFNQAKPADPAGVPTFQPGTLDVDALKVMLKDFVGLEGDGIDLESGIQSIGTPGAWEIFKLGSVSSYWVEMMNDLAGQTGAMFFIDPKDRKLIYRDDATPTAPFRLSDHPTGENCIGYREAEVKSDAMSGPLTNDACVWGIGKGAADPVFWREQDQDSIDLHGLWQWADLYTQTSKEETVKHRAQTYLYGSPAHHRGHNKDQDFVYLTIFEHGLRAGMVVDVESLTYDWRDNVPVRGVMITFPTPTSVRWDLQLSHTIDIPFAAVDPWPISGETPTPVSSNPSDFPGSRHLTPVWWELWEHDGALGASKFAILSRIESYVSDNVPWPIMSEDWKIHCGKNEGKPNDVGAGGWMGWRDAETWYLLDKSSVLFQSSGLAIEVPDMSTNVEGVALGGSVRVGVRVKEGDPSVGDLWNWLYISSVGLHGGTVLIPQWALGDGDPNENVYVILSPSWKCSRVEIPFCDISYKNTDEYQDPCGFVGPRCTGEESSGRLVAPIFMWFNVLSNTISSPPGINPGPPTSPPTASLTTIHQYQTQYPYVPGTLEVWVNGHLLRHGIDYQETDPAHGIFTINENIDLSGGIQTKYRHASETPTTPPGGGPGGAGPGGAPDPGVSNPPPPGTTYRPKHQRQLGHGTIYDGVNCNMTASAMLLDRHTMGAYSPTNGSPRSTPVTMRYYSGVTARAGTGWYDALHAWTNGWREDAMYPGITSFQYFVNQINAGRGASAAGNYSVLNNFYPGLSSSRSFSAGHQIYINEQFQDGSFLVSDPLAHGPRVWPYNAVRDYVVSIHGGADAYYSKKTRSTK